MSQYRSALVARAQTDSVTEQSKPIPGRETEMVANRAGGFVFKVDCWTRLGRFLILGSDAPTYYADAREMTLSNIDGVLACLREDGLRVVREIVDVSVNGRAPKNDPALYALALCTAYGVHGKPGVEVDLSDRASVLTRHFDPVAERVRKAAFEALPKVARTGTHLMQFIGYMEALRGWGPMAFKGVAAWIERHPNLELQAVKYRQREGWTLRDICRLSHPKVEDEDMRALIDWIVHRDLTESEIRFHDEALELRALQAKNRDRLDDAEALRLAELEERFALSDRPLPKKATARRHDVRAGGEVVAEARRRFRLVDALYLAREAMDEAHAKAAEQSLPQDKADMLSGLAVSRVIRSHSLPREGVPTEVLNSKDVWDALLVDMPLTALVRNLNKMTQVGVLATGTEAADYVCQRLRDQEWIRKGRLHPFAILVAMKVYARGLSPTNPTSRWTPVPAVVHALNDAFYLAFKAVEPTGLRVLQGFDISGSMTTSFLTAGKDRFGRPVAGPISARVASAAMGMVVNAVEHNVHNVAFCGYAPTGRYRNIRPEMDPRGWQSPNGAFHAIENYLLPVDMAGRRLDDVCKEFDGMSMGTTDVAAPILYAMDRGLEVDLFITYTDNETWVGKIHPAEALREYRRKTGIPAKMVAVAMTATEYSVADPKDAGSLNVVGFDADAPSIIMGFGKQ